MKIFDLTGRVALVTGGSKGLGKAMARGLAEAGADIVISSRHENELKPALAEILKGTDISRIDRGDTKSVRVVFDLTPKLLAAARAYVPTPPPQQPSNGPAGEKSRHK